MKILLIYPYFLDPRPPGDDAESPPMGLYYVGAMLRAHGHHVRILNWYAAQHSFDQIRQELRAADPDFIGFAVLNANRWGAIEIAAVAKAVKPGVQIVFGGIGATYLVELLLTQSTDIDYIICGEGETGFLQLVEAWQARNHAQVNAIPGLARRTAAGRIQRNPPARPRRNLDELPMPARYFTFQHVALTRGCASRCTFCGSPDFWQGKVRFHSTEYFVTQLSLLHQRGVNFFYVSDDTFTVSKPRVLEICRRIIDQQLPIHWAAIARVDQVDAEILRWMRRAGCIQISYGVESGAPAIRDVLNKGIATRSIESAFALTRSHGIMPRVYFIYGAAGESDATIQATLDLMARIKPLAAIFYILDIFPGTQLYQEYQARTGRTDAIWLMRREDIMYYETDPGLDPEIIQRWGRQLRNGFHKLLPQCIESLELVDDPELTPFHADFYSRLGMTLLSGDYAAIKAIPRKQSLARLCFQRALKYQPEARAFLGLAILDQKRGRPTPAIETATRGLAHFPHHQDLTLCLGVSHLAAGDPSAALACFEKFPRAPAATNYRVACHEALGEIDQANILRQKLI